MPDGARTSGARRLAAFALDYAVVTFDGTLSGDDARQFFEQLGQIDPALFSGQFAGFTLYIMSPDERRRLVRNAVRIGLFMKDGAVRVHSTRDPFHDALRSRTPWPIVTPAIVVLNVVVFARKRRSHLRPRARRARDCRRRSR